MTTLKDLRYHTCTKKDPWREDMGKRGLHPDAIEGEPEDGPTGYDIVLWHCPTCGVRWKHEIIQ